MHVKRVRAKNFRRFADLEIVDLPPTTKLVIVAGPNGNENHRSSIFFFDSNIVASATLVGPPFTTLGFSHPILQILPETTSTSSFMKPRGTILINFSMSELPIAMNLNLDRARSALQSAHCSTIAWAGRSTTM
jgi:hypothetical protein